MSTDTYTSPLGERYASKEMLYLFSPDFKFTTWRRLWIALAEAERELGLDISAAQIEQMKANIEPVDYVLAAQYENKLRHDVMAHIHAWGDVCPDARPIIHLGATSCYVGDNTDLIIMDKAMELIRAKLCAVIEALCSFAEKHASLPCLAFTHFQPAQPTTVGKRATLWTQELLLDLADCSYILSDKKLLGSKGTTGTQASFLELFNGDYDKVKRLDTLVAEKMGYCSVYPVSGQTYSRKQDSRMLNVLGGIAQSASKFANDIRLLQHLKQVEEPFGKNQIGSSAMAYKRNPMRCERINSLSRYILTAALNPAMTSSSQWLERTLDDSANKRIAVSEAFLAADAVLTLYLDVASGLVVYPKVVEAHLRRELPFMATENILMEAVKRGGDRQTLHENIRVHSMEASRIVKEEGGECDLLERIASDPAFGVTLEQMEGALDPSLYVGCAPMQTLEFVREVARPALYPFREAMEGVKAEVRV
ncbi:MAG: adenylosuccinate lyase [Eubacteriales bacterium]